MAFPWSVLGLACLALVQVDAPGIELEPGCLLPHRPHTGLALTASDVCFKPDRWGVRGSFNLTSLDKRLMLG